jgi:hypothetical protein
VSSAAVRENEAVGAGSSPKWAFPRPWSRLALVARPYLSGAIKRRPRTYRGLIIPGTEAGMCEPTTPSVQTTPGEPAVSRMARYHFSK